MPSTELKVVVDIGPRRLHSQSRPSQQASCQHVYRTYSLSALREVSKDSASYSGEVARSRTGFRVCAGITVVECGPCGGDRRVFVRGRESAFTHNYTSRQITLLLSSKSITGLLYRKYYTEYKILKIERER